MSYPSPPILAQHRPCPRPCLRPPPHLDATPFAVDDEQKTKNQTSDAAFIPAGWDSKRLIDGLLSPDKTPWGPKATFSEVVVPPPGAVRRGVSGGGDGGDGSAGGWTDSDSGGDGGGPTPGGKGAGRGGGGGETVESEEAWLSSLGKQVAGADAKSRWSGAIATVSKQAKASKVGGPLAFRVNLGPQARFHRALAHRQRRTIANHLKDLSMRPCCRPQKKLSLFPRRFVLLRCFYTFPSLLFFCAAFFFSHPGPIQPPHRTPGASSPTYWQQETVRGRHHP